MPTITRILSSWYVTEVNLSSTCVWDSYYYLHNDGVWRESSLGAGFDTRKEAEECLSLHPVPNVFED